MLVDKRINKLKIKISKLRYADILFKFIFSSKTKYNPIKVNEDEILKFEITHQLLVPPQLKLFLQIIGYGAGPYKGILSLTGMENELEEWKIILNSKGDLKNDFELTNADAIQIIENNRVNGGNYSYKQLKTLNGILPIATDGCTYFYYIVLNGEQKGKIWSINIEGFDTMPAGITQEYDFLTWYEKWLLK